MLVKIVDVNSWNMCKNYYFSCIFLLLLNALPSTEHGSLCRSTIPWHLRRVVREPQ